MRYRFGFRGIISPEALEALQPISYEAGASSTTIQIDVLDDAHLQGVIELISRLGAHVEAMQQVDVFREMEARVERGHGDE